MPALPAPSDEPEITESVRETYRRVTDAVMSSTYNARPRGAEAWVEGDRWVMRDLDRRGSGLRSEPRIGDGDEHDKKAMTEPVEVPPSRMQAVGRILPWARQCR